MERQKIGIVEFLFETKICESKGEARRGIKNRMFSIDSEKIEKEDFEVDAPGDLGWDDVEVKDFGDWFAKQNLDDVDKVARNLFSRFKTVKILSEAKKNKILDLFLKDFFLVHKGKKKAFIVKL